MRELCKSCTERPRAVNYHKDGKVFYRTKCDHCRRKGINSRPLWVTAGYKKKTKCDRCGFSSKFLSQFSVFYIDGNLSNCRYTNLKTVCANCQRLLHSEEVKWKQGDLVPDNPTRQIR